MKTIGLASLLLPFLLAFVLGSPSPLASVVSGTGSPLASARPGVSAEESLKTQERLKMAWVQTRLHAPPKSQAAIIHEWLAPLTGVVVSARANAQGLAKYRLTETLARQTIERRLRANGIEVLDEHPPGNSRPVQHERLTVATLCVEILGIVRSDGNVAAICILLKLQQEVAQVAADTPNFARADTWQRATFALVTPRDIRMCCLKSLEELAGQFTRDWLDAHDDQSEEGPERL